MFELSSQKYGGLDPGSEIQKKPIPDSGSRGQKGTGIPDLQHWKILQDIH
jgi:hypothetical protein